ncbi:hypothetical protein [Absidia glauca]|uniref:Uncharacterized protein n=1 Tax=Absidia glauca TaxID=4829 RepID=A0A168MZI6_ABSGL|nr:hypothetical protein [Absidia glauca]
MLHEKPDHGELGTWPTTSIHIPGALVVGQQAMIPPPANNDRRFRTITPRTIKRERRPTKKKTRAKRARMDNSSSNNNSNSNVIDGSSNSSHKNTNNNNISNDSSNSSGKNISNNNNSNDSSALLSSNSHSPPRLSSPSDHADQVPKEEDETWEIHIDDLPKEEEQYETWEISDHHVSAEWNQTQVNSDVSDCSSVIDLCPDPHNDADGFYDALDKLDLSPDYTTDTSEDYLSPLEN